MNNTIPQEQIDYYAAYMGLQREMEKLLQENTQLRAAGSAIALSPDGASSDPSISSIKSIPSMESTTTPAASLSPIPAAAGRLPELPAPNDIIQWAIIKAGIDLINLLLEKNRMYGASVFFPQQTFARASWREAIYVRLDDKLARLRSGQADDKEDPSTDIAGYLVLEKSGRLLEDHGVIPAEAPSPLPPGASVPSTGSAAACPPMAGTATQPLESLSSLRSLSSLETRIKVLEVANDSLTQYSQNLTRERDALQARIDAGTQVWSTDTDLSVREWVDCPMEQATLTARVIDVQAVEPSV